MPQFSDDAVTRISRAVRRVEGGAGGRLRAEAPPRHGESLYDARVTGAADGDGNYPATIVAWTGSAWRDYDTCRLRAPNGEPLTSGARYAGSPIGVTAAGKMLLRVIPAADWVVRGKLDGSLSAGGSATMSIWYYNGSAQADTGANVTVYDWLLASGSIASGKKVMAFYDARDGRYYVGAAECP